MRLSRKRRAAVVELLRCAADRADFRGGEITLSGPFTVARRSHGRAVSDVAWCARVDMMRDLHGDTGDTDDMTNDDYKLALLEAAARVEEGSWP